MLPLRSRELRHKVQLWRSPRWGPVGNCASRQGGFVPSRHPPAASRWWLCQCRAAQGHPKQYMFGTRSEGKYLEVNQKRQVGGKKRPWTGAVQRGLYPRVANTMCKALERHQHGVTNLQVGPEVLPGLQLIYFFHICNSIFCKACPLVGFCFLFCTVSNLCNLGSFALLIQDLGL